MVVVTVAGAIGICPDGLIPFLGLWQVDANVVPLLAAWVNNDKTKLDQMVIATEALAHIARYRSVDKPCRP